ncbi:hypothetical protein GPALN_011982 [Globodera pallida]|nr:hypothetical protein GPALN_011982 [Globodera pallida]
MGASPIEGTIDARGQSGTPFDADTLYGQNDKIEPYNDKESTANQPEEEQKKSDQLEHLREKIKQFELELKETKGIANILDFYTDFFRIAGAIVLFIVIIYTVKYQKEQQPNIVHLQKTVITMREIGWSSVIAEKPMPKNHTAFPTSKNISIGLATKRVPLGTHVRSYKTTYAHLGKATSSAAASI